MSKPKPESPFPKVPPFVQKKTQPRSNGVDVRGLLSTSLMLVSLGALTVAMIGATRMVFDIFNEGLANSLDGLWTKVVALAMAYFFGWVVALVSIRAFGNLIYPLIIKIFAWVCLTAVGLLYLKVIQKLYTQEYDVTRFWAYLLMLLGALFVLIGLHLLIEGHDLRPFSIPLLIISVLQLFAVVSRYIFLAVSVKPEMLWNDLVIFLTMISISALMLMHLGMLSGLRNAIDNLFRPDRKRSRAEAEDEDQADSMQHWLK